MKDLIVVGAGPVGSHLAKRFAEKGRDVLVIERGDEIGKPLACSGHVSPDIWDFVPKDERENLLQNEIEGARFHNSGRDFTFTKGETVSYVIDRVDLDRVKADRARKAGAEYVLGEEVERVEETEKKALVETDSSRYEAKMVAGCDGPSSTVRDEVDLGEPGKFYQGILGFTEEDDGSDFVDVYLDVPEFFGWRIPRGDSVEYGVAVPQGENPVEWLEKITAKHGVEADNICAGAIPVGPVNSSVSDRAFIVGDAAGQTKPFTGGGILYGIRSADKAAEQIKLGEKSTLKNYEEEWRDELRNEILIGEMIRRGYSFPSPIQNLGMWIFRGNIHVHMDHPTTLFSLSQLKAMLTR